MPTPRGKVEGGLQRTGGETLVPRRWGRRLHHKGPPYTRAQRWPRLRRSRSSPGVVMDGAGGGPPHTPVDLPSPAGRARRTERATALAAAPPFPCSSNLHSWSGPMHGHCHDTGRSTWPSCAPKLTAQATISPIWPRFVLHRSPICATVPSSYLTYSAIWTPPWTSSYRPPVLDPATLLELPMDLKRRRSRPLFLVGEPRVQRQR